ncbi:hypothetical protein I4U23_011166, partial [Adineta vaga]
MINPQHVVRLLSKYILKLPRSIVRSTDPTVRDEDVAKQLFETLLSILNSTEYHFEHQDTLDYSFIIDQFGEDDDSDSDEDDSHDSDYNEEENDDDDKSLLNQFSIEYMKKVIFYYDEVNPRT